MDDVCVRTRENAAGWTGNKGWDAGLILDEGKSKVKARADGVELSPLYSRRLRTPHPTTRASCSVRVREGGRDEERGRRAREEREELVGKRGGWRSTCKVVQRAANLGEHKTSAKDDRAKLVVHRRKKHRDSAQGIAWHTTREIRKGTQKNTHPKITASVDRLSERVFGAQRGPGRRASGVDEVDGVRGEEAQGAKEGGGNEAVRIKSIISSGYEGVKKGKENNYTFSGTPNVPNNRAPAYAHAALRARGVWRARAWRRCAGGGARGRWWSRRFWGGSSLCRNGMGKHGKEERGHGQGRKGTSDNRDPRHLLVIVQRLVPPLPRIHLRVVPVCPSLSPLFLMWKI
ncbi:hypothetical protein B0H13DRAFT_1861459 [Mycena leptocephala]|nr:hypothetical protein B0H13DRAFT_1861459 [Mycena leptocephala]